PSSCTSFSFNPPSTTQHYTLSLHDALPISAGTPSQSREGCARSRYWGPSQGTDAYPCHRQGEEFRRACSLLVSGERQDHLPDLLDRKSTRLNSSHRTISYAVFCLKKKKKNK